MRLDKFLSQSGIGSRKDVRKDIKRGKVLVNGEVQKDFGLHIDELSDDIQYDGKRIRYRQFVYIMLHKPSGYISATTDNFHDTVLDLIEGYDNYELFPVGRLDIDTEGLIILTNDGQLAHRVLSPKRHIPKTYLVHLDNALNDRDINMLENGIQLEDGYICKPADIQIIEDEDVYKLHITITEGKYHQVKRMFLALGKHVLYLKRISMGTLKLDDTLNLGEYRELSEQEVMFLEKKEGEHA